MYNCLPPGPLPTRPLTRGQASRDRLLELGYGVSWHEYAVGHAVCEVELQDFAQWVRGALGAA